MRIVFISDTHEQHDYIGKLPEGDILVHAGDFTMHGTEEAVRRFDKWLAAQPFDDKIFIAGNHDRGHDLQPEYFEPLITNAHYLKNSGVTIKGLKIWGSPYTPFFHSDYWRFHTKTIEERQKLWSQIPRNLDVLITHGPPKQMLDLTREGDFAGDADLLIATLFKEPKIHVFGHIHEGYGMRRLGPTMFFNASLLDRAYHVANRPWVVDYEHGRIVKINGEEIQQGESGKGIGQRPSGPAEADNATV